MGKSKMSKSKGNVVNPLDALDKWGIDGVRWYLMRNGGSLADDADYSEDEMGVSYRTLADQVGNLLSRISSPKILAKMQAFSENDRDKDVEETLSGLRDRVCAHMEEYAVTRACDAILEVVALVSTLASDRAYHADCHKGKQNGHNTPTMVNAQPHESDHIRL
jgi:methionyl-tRNA synthetase